LIGLHGVEYSERMGMRDHLIAEGEGREMIGLPLLMTTTIVYKDNL
jgi:hypothetical protein